MNKKFLFVTILLSFTARSFSAITPESNANNKPVTFTFGYDAQESLDVSREQFDALKNVSQTIKDLCDDLGESKINCIPLYSGIQKSDMQILLPCLKKIAALPFKNVKGIEKNQRQFVSSEYQNAIDEIIKYLPKNFEQRCRLIRLANYLDIQLILHACAKSLAQIYINPETQKNEFKEFQKNPQSYFSKFGLPSDLENLIVEYIIQNQEMYKEKTFSKVSMAFSGKPG